ncbi:TadE-like protein [Bowdeniella nasicola]|uniref:TadE-like protein n=1 Tax=Bowdeniella nasicola TaxID=208480 RepID=A0A1H3Z3U8_9ACTO|nr:TadE family protein [Bowdeniella nasicola]SEA18148.1 TadE-like protein [Bowdeniella nasicola]
MKRALSEEEGSVIPEYVMVLTVLIFVLLALIQFVFAIHVRSILVDSAAEGARRAALMKSTDAEGIALTEQLVSSALVDNYASNVAIEHVNLDGLAAVRVTISAPLPLIGLIGPDSQLTVSAHAVEEEQFLTQGRTP